MDYIWLIILLILGIMMIVKPKFLWEIEHLLTVKNGEPSELYITLMRVGGVFFMICAIICAIYVLI